MNFFSFQILLDSASLGGFINSQWIFLGEKLLLYLENSKPKYWQEPVILLF